MRGRHLPRVCHSCRAPMARQEETCWRCGTRWASEDAPRTRLTVIAGGRLDEDRPRPAIAIAARAVADARPYVDRDAP